jgi:ComF family protein
MAGNKVRREVCSGPEGPRLTGLARRLGDFALRLLFPPRCLRCDTEIACPGDDPNLCDGCGRALAPADWRGCPRCGAAVETVETEEACVKCRAVRLWFDTVIPLGAYADTLRQVVLRMKRPSEELLAGVMGRLLARRRGPALEAVEADVVIPVPMFWARWLGRGTNSPTTLAWCVGRGLGLPVLDRALVRVRNTLPQPELPPGQRFQNVRGAFRWRRGYDIHGTRVLLVDDILTTGATCSEIGRVLKKAGASRVAVAVVARAEGDRSG